MWSLCLRSLCAIDVAQLVESEILEQIIDVFLSSSHKIQQVTYT
jgi:hypothetical protein